MKTTLHQNLSKIHFLMIFVHLWIPTQNSILEIMISESL